MKGGVNIQKLLKHFERPEVRSTVDVGILAKAFIFYSLGIILFPTRSRTGQPHYLPLLAEPIHNYDWGSVVLAHIKSDMGGIVKKQGKLNLCCFSLALTVFALERFPSLTQGILLGSNLPTELPLSLGWIDVLVKYFRPSIKRKKAE